MADKEAQEKVPLKFTSKFFSIHVNSANKPEIIVKTDSGDTVHVLIEENAVDLLALEIIEYRKQRNAA